MVILSTPSASFPICRRIWSPPSGATLEEVLEADLVLHVARSVDPDNQAQASDVLRILADLGIDEKEGPTHCRVWNKIDKVEPKCAKRW